MSMNGSGHPHGGGHPHGASHTGSAKRSYRPGAGAAARAYEMRTGIKAPRIVAWEITRSCNLACAHCRAASEYGAYEGELSLDEAKALIDNITSITDPILILTGGEPLLRPDIWDIAAYARCGRLPGHRHERHAYRRCRRKAHGRFGHSPHLSIA